MLCLYKPYSFNRSEAGGRAVPVRGIRLTVLRAWTKTRSIGQSVRYRQVFSDKGSREEHTDRVRHYERLDQKGLGGKCLISEFGIRASSTQKYRVEESRIEQRDARTMEQANKQYQSRNKAGKEKESIEG